MHCLRNLRAKVPHQGYADSVVHGNTLALSGNSWDNGVNSTYTKDSGTNQTYRGSARVTAPLSPPPWTLFLPWTPLVTIPENSYTFRNTI